MTCAFVFPGQGAQAVGMGKDLADAFTPAKHVFEEVDDALEQHLSRLMFNGPKDELVLTENAQPALMAMSMAVIKVLQGECAFDLGLAGKYVAGHSLGEYTALTAAGAFRLADAARILKIRGRAMQEAVPVGEGAMAALLGVELDQAQDYAAQGARKADGTDGGICSTGNDNAPGQVVISGDTEAVARALAIAVENGAKRSIMLAVSAPFHCALMAPAAEVMAGELASAVINRPVVPVIANVSAAEVSAPEDIRRRLVEQVTSMVRWRESVLYMRDNGIDTVVEIGAGKVLTGLNRRIDRDITGVSVQTPDDIEAFAATL
ncbi:MAG: ACP S-malonyltransferase [Pseudomonadota bacterium]|nr:ACP S-malonyltransferase [Pseudomonadota bacterium]